MSVNVLEILIICYSKYALGGLDDINLLTILCDLCLCYVKKQSVIVNCLQWLKQTGLLGANFDEAQNKTNLVLVIILSENSICYHVYDGL